MAFQLAKRHAAERRDTTRVRGGRRRDGPTETVFNAMQDSNLHNSIGDQMAFQLAKTRNASRPHDHPRPSSSGE